MNGKGSARRPTSVTTEEWERRWALAFGQEENAETWHTPHDEEQEPEPREE